MGTTKGYDSAYPLGDQKNLTPEIGLTKREYYAGLAMQALVSEDVAKNAGLEAVRYADALLEALNADN